MGASPVTLGGIMRKFMVPFSILIAILLCAGGYFGIKSVHAHNAVNQELDAQKSEVKECERRLALFHAAWERYRADHKGAEPSIEALFPKYINDPNLLICPTAQRLVNMKKSVAQGSITIGGKSYPETYG